MVSPTLSTRTRAKPLGKASLLQDGAGLLHLVLLEGGAGLLRLVLLGEAWQGNSSLIFGKLHMME